MSGSWLSQGRLFQRQRCLSALFPHVSRGDFVFSGRLLSHDRAGGRHCRIDSIGRQYVGMARPHEALSPIGRNARHSVDLFRRRHCPRRYFSECRGHAAPAFGLYRCWEAVCDEASGPVHTIYMSPCGHTFRQADAIRLSKMENIIIVCGHYEGIDQRFIDECVDEEISLGDFVLTGGEIAAMAVTDAVCRMVPGVLADAECFEDESHFNGLLEYPQYTRPAVWHGREVPQILLSGNHEKVRQWRRKQSLRRTRARRPDMYEKLDLSSKQDKTLLKEMELEDGQYDGTDADYQGLP